MSFSYGWRGPNIIKEGLVLYLNAGSPNSYFDKTSTTWKDISGNNNNGTLTNFGSQTIYNSSNGGSIVFDGTNDYVDCGTISSLGSNSANPFSVSCWVKKNINGSQTTFEKFQGSLPAGIFAWLVRLDEPSTYDVSFYLNRSQQVQTTISSLGVLSLDTWVNITVTYDGSFGYLYINGVFKSSGATNNGTTSTRNFILGYTSNNNGQFLNGNISNVLGYTRTLSAAEVLQNYNVTKSMFDISGLYETMTYTATNTITITNNGTYSVNMFKTSGSNAWDSQCYSTTPFTAPCTIEFEKLAGSTDNGVSYAMIGWNTDPTTNDSYTSMDYASYPFATNTYYVYNNGTAVLSSGVWSTSSKFYIVYGTDGFIRHYNGSTLLYSVNYGAGQTVYVDSSIYSVNSTFGGFFNVRVRKKSWNGSSYV
jgi:hypothetical protein